MNCAKCGAENASMARQCVRCGVEFAPTNNSGQGAASATAEQMAFYEEAVGFKNAPYYLKHFKHFDQHGIGASWHWPAFFVSFYWMLYRKMWLWAFVYFFSWVPVSIVLAVIAQFSQAAAMAIWFAYLAAAFFAVPIYANAIYYKHVQKKISEAKNYAPERDKQLRVAAASGGTSGIALIFALIFVLITTIGMLAAIAIPAYHDYSTRAKIGMAINSSSDYKLAINEYVLQHEEWPQSIEQLSELQAQANVASEFSQISLGDEGTLVVSFTKLPAVEGKSVLLVPYFREDGSLGWECKGGEIAPKLLPLSCRNE